MLGSMGLPIFVSSSIFIIIIHFNFFYFDKMVDMFSLAMARALSYSVQDYPMVDGVCYYYCYYC